MHIEVIPVEYEREPLYWAVHVYGIREGESCLETVTPFDAVISPVPLGTEGVIVLGATSAIRIDYPPRLGRM